MTNGEKITPDEASDRIEKLERQVESTLKVEKYLARYDRPFRYPKMFYRFGN